MPRPRTPSRKAYAKSLYSSASPLSSVAPRRDLSPVLTLQVKLTARVSLEPSAGPAAQRKACSGCGQAAGEKEPKIVASQARIVSDAAQSPLIQAGSTVG